MPQKQRNQSSSNRLFIRDCSKWRNSSHLSSHTLSRCLYTRACVRACVSVSIEVWSERYTKHCATWGQNILCHSCQLVTSFLRLMFFFILLDFFSFFYSFIHLFICIFIYLFIYSSVFLLEVLYIAFFAFLFFIKKWIMMTVALFVDIVSIYTKDKLLIRTQRTNNIGSPTVIVIGNGIGDSSSNPTRSCLFISR